MSGSCDLLRQRTDLIFNPCAQPWGNHEPLSVPFVSHFTFFSSQHQKNQFKSTRATQGLRAGRFVSAADPELIQNPQVPPGARLALLALCCCQI